MQYECAGGHQRSYAQLGWTCGKDGLQRNLCEGSEMSRPPMVEMETDKLERGGERQMVWSTRTTVENLQVGGHGCWGGLQICWEHGWFVGNGSKQHGMVASCSKPWKVEAIFEMWKEPCIDGPGCLGDPSASGMTGTNAVVAWLTERRIVREIWRALATPLSISSQLGHCRDDVMVQCWGWDRVAAGMEDDVADGMESRKYAPMSTGSA